MLNLSTSDTAALAGIVGILAPLLTAVVQQPTWSTQVRRIVAVVIALVLGAATAAVGGQLGDGSTLLTALAAVLVASQATYGTLWGAATQAIEQATSPSKSLDGHVDDAETDVGQHRANPA